MRIQDMEQKSGLDRATIRYYEKEGLLVPQRSENGYRSYYEEDLNLLLKIKLLQQLGVRLSTIRSLQQGSEDFSAVLSDQILVLEKQIQENAQAKLVCQQIQCEGERYEDLDAQRYLQMLNTPAAPSKTQYTEPVAIEHHPIRRFCARWLDMYIVSVLVKLIVICLIRVRPFQGAFATFIGYMSYFLSLPLSAIMLHFWGTTPGKWIMGIRLENANGGNLRFSDAFVREINVAVYGMGLYIPIVELWRLYRSYKEDTAGEGNSWNQDTEIVYTDWTVFKKILLPVSIAVCFAISLFCARQALLPRYRYENITMEQFLQNYEDCQEILNLSSGAYSLDKNGNWESDYDSYPYTTLHEDEDHIRSNFQYDIANGHLIAVRYTDSWENADFHYAIPSYCQIAVFTMIGSRPSASYVDYLLAAEELEEQICNQLAAASASGSLSGSYTVSGVCVSWDIMIQNCDAVSGNIIYSLDEEPVPYTLDLLIEVIE